MTIKWTDQAIAAFWLAMPSSPGPLKRRETEIALNAAVEAQGLIQPEAMADFDSCSRPISAIKIQEIYKNGND